MSEETLTENFKRSYEVSIWTLQDSFITVLKPFNLEPKGQIQEAKMTLKDDGTQELSFSIPMYIRDEDGTKHENPIWYNTRNGTIIADLRKIKVIFDKGGHDEAVFEFMIIKVTESHENDELRCEVECEGLAFHELGKIGYKISLNEEDYTEDWMEWSKDTSADRGDEPAATIDYWMYKVLNKNRINWTYSVQMDWGAYDGTIIVGIADDSARVGYAYIEDLYTGKLAYTTPKQYSDLTDEEKEYLNNLRIAKGMRRYDKIYEENYVTSWSVDDNKNMITPVSVEKRREKQRLINIEESNIYNITQTIAETFGVFCKYVYHYDDTYHIIGREIVFYNNFIQESSGHIDFTYPYHTNSISREMDATDTISKMFVKPLANDSASTGYANIMDTTANKSGEDYLLNFSYLHNIGTISEEQFNEIEPYEVKMRQFNDLMIPIEKRIVQLNASLPEKEAELKIVQDSQTLSIERISAADDQLNDILKRTNPNNDDPQSIIVDGSAPVRATPIQEKNGTYSIAIRQQGVVPGTVKVYSTYTSNTGALSGPCLFDSYFDESGNLTKLISVTNIEFDENNIIKIKYLTYEYVPQLWFENVKKTYTSRLAQDQQKEAVLAQEIADIKQELADLQVQYDEYKDEKEKAIIDFQNMMGPALREGYWQPEDEYAGYGDKYSDDYTLTAASAFDNSKLASIGWDNEPFEGEQLNYYLEGVDQERVYYPFIWIDQVGLNALTPEEYDKISFCYLDCATKDSFDNPLKYTRYWRIYSQMIPVYLRLKNSNTVAPAFLLTGATSLSDDSWADLMTIKGEAVGGKHDASIALVTTDISDPENPELVITPKWHNIGARFMTSTEAEDYEVVYPRFQVMSLEMQDTDDQLSLLQNNDVLENFKNYEVLIRDENYYVTLDSYTLIKSGSLFGGTLRFNYTIANTALLIYLDAIQVLKENCMPKVSYQITPSLVSKEFLRVAYKGLDKISHINDYELKFENVLGYISEMELDLDRPQEDTYEIKNYKTKFEDLFSTIVAQTEEMKKNSIEIGLAASAFTATGDLKGSQVQSAMDRVDLNYAFNQGALTIDEANGIWATSDSGVVAMRGGGIFTATDKDQDGNWIWNTGILPSGINASLITTGQLDTNLIRIYAGDTIAFQMNADGLYAYKWDLGSDSYQNQYVVHNKDGLFLHAATGSSVGNVIMNQDVDRVEISWDGLKLRNNNNETVFYASPDTGDLNITGKISATELEIGNGSDFTDIDTYINSNTSKITGAYLNIDADNGLIEMKTSSGGTTNAFTMNSSGIRIDTNANFHVTGSGIGIDSADGIFRLGPNSATDAVLYFRGTSNTNFTFRVGPWNINTTSLYRNNATFGAADGLYFGLSGLSLSNIFQVSTTTTSTTVTFNNFTVTDGTGGTLFDISKDPTSSAYSLSLGALSLTEDSINSFKRQLGINENGIYTATKKEDLPTDVDKGSIGVVYTDVIQSSSVSLTSSNVTDTAGSASTAANINSNLSVAYPLLYTTGSSWQATHNTNVTFHGLTPKWWNVCCFESDLVTGNKYLIPSGLGRVGSGATKGDVSFLSSKVKVNQAVSAGNNITVNFTYIINPNTAAYSNKVYPVSTGWSASSFDIDIFTESGTQSLGHGTFTPSGSYSDRTFKSASINLTLTGAITANTTYDIVFSCTPVKNNLIFIVQRPLLAQTSDYTDGTGGSGGTITVIGSNLNTGVTLSGSGSTTNNGSATLYVMAQTTASTKNWIQVATGTATS